MAANQAEAVHGRRRRTRAVAVVVAAMAALAVAACGAGADRADPATGAERSGPTPDVVAQMWDQPAPWVAAASPDPLVVPGPDAPASVELTALVRPREVPEPQAPSPETPGPFEAAQTLYADPTSPEPWTDAAVMVGRVEGSDVEGSFLFGRGDAVTIQGRRGQVGRFAGLWFASWSIPTCDVCDQQAFVIGHGLSRERVLSIAESVRQSPGPTADPATLPEGLRAMGSLHGTTGTAWTRPWAEQLRVRTGEVEATLTVWTGDPRLYAHLAFWAPPGRPLDGASRWREVIADGRRVVSIEVEATPSGDERSALEAAARALVPGDDTAVARALDEAASNLVPVPSTEELCPEVEGRWATLSGVVDRAVWAVTLHATEDGLLDSCASVTTVEGEESGGGTGSRLGPVPAGGARVYPEGIGTGAGPSFLRVDGDVPASAVRVRVESGDTSVDAVLADTGPEPGRRWFSVAILDETAVPQRATVTAFDADGSAIATGSTPS